MATVTLYARDGLIGVVKRELERLGWAVQMRGFWNGDHQRLPANRRGEGDLALCVHWPRLIPEEWLSDYMFGGVNLHPNLSLGYTVEDPVGRALKDGHSLMSVAAHRMTGEADSGPVLCEHWRTIPAGSSVEYAYELLRPLYVSVLREALEKL